MVKVKFSHSLAFSRVCQPPFSSQFNELMNKLDPNDDDSDSDREKKTPAKNASRSTPVPGEAIVT